MTKPANIVPLITQSEIAQRVAELGRAISADYGDEEVVLVCVLKGSFVFAADLARHMTCPLRVEFFGVKSYGAQTSSSGVVQITLDLAHPIEGRNVLIVEDIIDTGLTLSYLSEQLRARGPKTLRLAALLHKPARKRREVQIDYLGFTIEDVFVVGYGLDHDERHRNLPFLGVVEVTE